jgi:hypothetical protein
LQRSEILKGTTFFAIALSIKGGAMIWAPCIFLVISFSIGIPGVIMTGIYLVAFNAVLAAPYLMTNPKTYLKQSFEFGR